MENASVERKTPKKDNKGNRYQRIKNSNSEAFSETRWYQKRLEDNMS
jgi:hypothetical protein